MFTAMRLLFGLLVILYHHGEKKIKLRLSKLAMNNFRKSD